MTKSYSNQVAINDINLDLEFSGLGLLGPNGSGKTTFIKLLLGIIHPSQGTIDVNIDLSKIRVVSDQPVLPDKMSVDEWVFTLEQIYGQHLQGVDIQTDLGLEGQWQIKNLSAGQRRKCALLPAFYGSPDLIIIDEPSNYLDIATKEYILKLLKRHCDHTGSNIIISSHDVDEVRLFADTVLLLKEGRVMKNVKLDKQLPELFSIKVTDIDALSEQLEEEGIYYFHEDTIQGKVIKAEPVATLWQVLERYSENGGQIFSFKAIDVLERMIEDLAK